MSSKHAIIYYGGFLNRSGGAFTHAQMLVPVLEAEGWTVSTVTLDKLPLVLRYLPHAVEKAVNAVYLPLGFIWKARLTKFLYKLLFSKTADLCIFEDIYLAWDTPDPAVTVLHAVWSDNLQAFAVRPERMTALLAEEVRLINAIPHPVVTVSQPYLDYLTRTHFNGQLSKPLQVVELGVDQTPFQHAERPPRRAYALIYCGALEARKNLFFLLQVFARLYETDSRYTLTVIGDGPEKNRLDAFVKTRELLVVFLGRLENRAVIDELNRHEIYLHTSVKESFSFALLEAKLAGLKTCAYAGLDVPAEFIDAAIDGFVTDEWVEGIRGLSHVMPRFEGSRFTAARMAAATLAVAEEVNR